MNANTIDVSEKTYEQWRDLRTSFLGGSDAAVALGMSKWKSPYMLWLEKTGRFSFDADNPVMKFGRQWEGQVRTEFSRRTGFEVTEPDQMFIHSDPELGMLSANVDGIIEPNQKHSKRGILEIKCTLQSRIPVLADWDDVPTEYQCQVMHYLNVLNLDYCYLQLFFRDSATYPPPLLILRDDSMIAEMNQKLSSWWVKHVEGDIAPPMESSEDLKIAYPDSEPDSSKQATDSIRRSYNALKNVRERISQLKDLKSSYEHDLKEFMGDTETLLDGNNQRLATWKSSNRRRFSTSDFKDDYPKLYKEYANTNKIRIFRIK
ncbi:putative phage-type endonuclease [Fodinibius salinus]|uniref:Putative phage-type endonuclease n=1 Tax=Fodinibius salinus TaxID=860790 RepID=A0A5D3YLN9_9BACT|nr:YqaJ viral recombinase family protein [Fodinibius salinus]TYP94864.1 putative phage-type endonuclease [Fodinibius salinus]